MDIFYDFNDIYENESHIEHIGMPRRSGRYPWGSGENPFQHESWYKHPGDFLDFIKQARKEKYTYTDEDGELYTGDNAIAKVLGIKSTELRSQIGIAKDEKRLYDVYRVESLRKDGLNDSEISRKTGIPLSTVKSLFDADSKRRMLQAKNAAEFIKNRIDEVGMVDVGTDVCRELGISQEKMNQALTILKSKGYEIYGGRVEQPTNRKKFTTMKVACPPGTEHREIFDDWGKVNSLMEYTSDDGGQTFRKTQYPASLDRKRVMIRYADDVGPDGFKGIQKDGVIEIRRGVKDLSLGNSMYSQVRILVGKDKYLKGMAVYADGKDMPDGVDVIFNTNKSSNKSFDEVLKSIKEDDPNNPFGALIKADGQYEYIDSDGKKKLSPINKTREEGDWDEWKKAVPSQFLSKQPKYLAKKQIDLAIADKKDELAEIMSYDVPEVKRYYLNKFAESCDKQSETLQAAAFPDQHYNVILPINSLRNNEIYAPRYDNGTKLALVRYPHGGTFEIPILTVNNRNKEGEKIIGPSSIDAVGITSEVAARLSGADFDGDTVMCIPTNDPEGKINILSTAPLAGLKGYDPKDKFQGTLIKTVGDTKIYERNGVKFKGMRATQKEMGVATNLISDMTILGASNDELERAVKYSMVVIDAEKHGLDYKAAYYEYNIQDLKDKYQIKDNGKTGGASTLLTRAKSVEYVPRRKGSPKVNVKGKPWYDPSRPEGSLIWQEDPDRIATFKKYDPKTGELISVKEVEKKTKITKMAATDDPRTLISTSNTVMENLYADYASTLKSLANQARLNAVFSEKAKRDPIATSKYAEEVQSLKRKLDSALLNRPRERAAIRLATSEIEGIRTAYKEKHGGNDMPTKDLKKLSQNTMVKYRGLVGSIKRSDRNIKISDSEWEAIKNRAISENDLKKILDNSDPDVLREKLRPKGDDGLTDARKSAIRAMANSNYTLKEIAKRFGISTSTVSNIIKGG